MEINDWVTGWFTLLHYYHLYWLFFRSTRTTEEAAGSGPDEEDLYSDLEGTGGWWRLRYPRILRGAHPGRPLHTMDSYQPNRSHCMQTRLQGQSVQHTFKEKKIIKFLIDSFYTNVIALIMVQNNLKVLNVLKVNRQSSYRSKENIILLGIVWSK